MLELGLTKDAPGASWASFEIKNKAVSLFLIYSTTSKINCSYPFFIQFTKFYYS